jgi:hypothetical protein
LDAKNAVPFETIQRVAAWPVVARAASARIPSGLMANAT